MGSSKVLNNTIKGVSSVISAVLINLLTGSIFTFPNLITYYQKFTDNKFNETKLYFVAPTGIFIHNSLPSITGILDDKFGTRILNIVGSLSLLGSQLIVYFFKNYILLIVAYALFGFCGSLTYFQSLKNCWKYFPNKKGLISGIIFSSFGLSAFIFTTIADAINKPKNNEKKTDKEIADGFKLYLKIFIICIISMGTLSSLLCFPYKKEEDYLERLSSEDEENGCDIDFVGESNKNHYSVQLKNEDNNEDNREGHNLTLKESIFSLDFLLCLSLASCTLTFGFLLTNTYRKFAEKNQHKENIIAILCQVFTLLNTFSRLIWGFISDKIGFKILYSIVCINQLICGSLIYFLKDNIVTYFIVVCFGVLSFSGHVILFPNLIHTKFGVENSVYLLGICGIFAGIAALIGPIISLFVLKDGKIEAYLKIYIIGTAPTIISLLITFFIKVDKMIKKLPIRFDDYYDYEEEEDYLSNKKENETGVELNLNKKK